MTKRDEETFVTLHKACRMSLKRFCKESDQTLNLLSLVKLFPRDTDKQAALRLQYEQENKAHADYTRCRHDLFAFLPDTPGIKAIKKKLRSGWPLDSKA